MCTDLAGRGHADGAGPVVVEVSELVGEPLHVVHLPVALAVYDHVVRRRHRALTHVLADEEEVRSATRDQPLSITNLSCYNKLTNVVRLQKSKLITFSGIKILNIK